MSWGFAPRTPVAMHTFPWNARPCGVDGMATGGRPDRTPTFTHTFRLEVDERHAQEFGTRFDAATRPYNDVPAECFRRARPMRQSRLWAKARALRADPKRRAELSQTSRRAKAQTAAASSAHGYRAA